MANTDNSTQPRADALPTPRVSAFLLILIFAGQIFLIGAYLLWSKSADLPLLINAKYGDTTVRLLMLMISLSCLIYCIQFYASVFRSRSYPNLTAMRRFMPFVPILAFLIMIIFVLCIVSQTFTPEKLANSIYAIADPSRWKEYTSVDPWPSLTIVMFGMALSTCLCISNITISILYIDEDNIDQLRQYVFYLHFYVSIIAMAYGLTLYATNTAFFDNTPGIAETYNDSKFLGIDKFIINYSIVVIIYFVAVFLVPAIRFSTLDSGRALITRLGSLTMPAWLLPIHAYLVAQVPAYKEIMELLGLVFPK